MTTSPNDDDDKIAICGYSYRLPGGLEDDEAIWKLLETRGFVKEEISSRYGKSAVPWDGFTDSPHRVASPYEGLITGGRELEFDCSLFGVSANDAKRMDPQIKMMLSVTWEALQCAGMDQSELHNSNTGVFTGHQTSAIASWRPPMGSEESDIPGRSGSMIANRISFHFNWMGPSFSVATACSSGITALDVAIKSLRCKECDVAAFGAVSYLGQVYSSVGFNALGIISKTGTSRSFDKDANGYMRSEGAFMFILKRLSDAERDGNKIFGTILGCALNAAGAEPDAEVLTQGRMIVAPVMAAQQVLMKYVVQMAGVDPGQVDYIEAHATGTSVGDKVEGNAIANVYGSEQREQPLRLGSARSNIGHMEAASFTMSLLKVILMLKNKCFAPISSHFRQANPGVPFEMKRMKVQTHCEPFPERDEPILVGINSFGFGGANGHCLVEEYKPKKLNWSKLPGDLKEKKKFMVPLSAKSNDALIENADRLAGWLETMIGSSSSETDATPQEEKVDIYRLTANLSTRMTHHTIRTAFAADSLTELKDRLLDFVSRAREDTLKDDEVVRISRRISAGSDNAKKTKFPSPRVLVVFPGQGAQWPGCGKDLYETELVFRRVVDFIDAEWVKLTGEKLSTVAFDDDAGEKLNDVSWAQPITFMIQVGLFEMIKSHGIHPMATVGHSAGEVASAYASGVYTLEEACQLVHCRAVAQSKASGSGRMLVLMQDSTSVEQTLEKHGFPAASDSDGSSSSTIEIACYNSRENTVVCGPDEAIYRWREKLEEEGMPKGTLIPGNIAFHSSHMVSIEDKLMEGLSKLGFDEPRKTEVPMISTVTGRVQKEVSSQYWWTNVRQPVDLLGAANYIRKYVQPDVLIEVSPHITLRSQIRKTYEAHDEAFPPYLFTLIRGKNTADMFARHIGGCFKAGLSIDFHSLYPRPEPMTHCLPHYGMKKDQMMDVNIDDEALCRRGTFAAGPLLGKPLQGFDSRYAAIFSKKHYTWMLDHIVQDKAIVPAAGYIELLLEAFDGEPICIKSARMLAPFVLSDDRRYMHTDIKPFSYDPQQFDFTITSRSHSGQNTKSTVHCVGTLEKLDKERLCSAIPVDIPRTLEDDSGNYHETLYGDAATFYTTMAARIGESFSYGPYFQTVQKVNCDLKTQRLCVKISIDKEEWANWDKMGYLLHPALLDGCLQSFLLYGMEACDFSGVPQMLEKFVFVRKPPTHEITCIYEPPEYIRGNISQKGQLAFGLGERSAGAVNIYGADGELIAYLGRYTSFHTNPKKPELCKSKHFMSWQPKSISTRAESIAARAVEVLNAGCAVGEAATLLIKDLVEKAHPDVGVPFLANVGECIVGDSTPPKFSSALQDCIKQIADAPVQYSLLSSDREFLSEMFQKHGKTNPNAHLRFLDHSEEPTNSSFLRRGVFEFMMIRVTVDDGDELDTGIDLEYLSSFVAPGGLVMIESKGLQIAQPVNWKLLSSAAQISSDSPSATPSIALYCTAPMEATIEPVECDVVTGESPTYTDAWRRINDINIEDDTSIDWDRAPQFKRVDYFCINDGGDESLSERSVLHTLPASLTDWIKKLCTFRSDADNLEPCLFTCYTTGAMREVKSPEQTGVWGAVRSIAAEVSETCKVEFRLIDLASTEDLQHVGIVEGMREREICIHNSQIWASRLVNIREAMPIAQLKSSDEAAFRLHTDNSGVITDLEFRTVPLDPLGPYDIEIEVKAAALNFRDIMVGLGKLPLLSYERSMLGRTVGMECAGVVVRCGADVKAHQIGDKVIAMQGGCIANRIRSDSRGACKLPSNLSFEEGCAALATHITAYYALCYLARLRKGQSVLVHSALGGVGQAAVAIAKLRGALVYGTASSEAKREELRKMGCVDAFDSRSTSWFSHVMKATENRGVDVVLNSLAGQHVDLCLEALAAGGCHCEIGKVDIYADRPVRMAVFRKNISFLAIDIDRLMMDDPDLVEELTQDCLELLQKQKVPAPAVTIYKYADYADAIRCMMNGQHRGKLVLIPPSVDEKLPVVDGRRLFDMNITKTAPRTVLISGCLGGFGLRVFSYIISQGAKNVLILDRDAERRRTLEWLWENSYVHYLQGETDDVRVEIVYADVSKYEDVVDAVNAVDRLQMPPIGSVFHLAGVLDDKYVGDVDHESFAKVYGPKANGAWNLHRATEGIKEMEHFVMFSSTSSVLGNPGQTNYSAANSFQDGLAEMRRSNGKPALSFCMGAVAETGMASRNANLLQMMKTNGMPAISCIFAIECLDSALRSGGHSIAVAALATTLRADVGHSDFLRTGAQLVSNSSAFKLGGSISMSKEMIMDFISQRVASMCGVEEVDMHEPLSSYGLNSISVAELISVLRQNMDYNVSPMELMTTATCESIAAGVMNANATSDTEKGIGNGNGELGTSSSDSAKDTEHEEPIDSWWPATLECKPSRFVPSSSEYFEHSAPPNGNGFVRSPATVEAAPSPTENDIINPSFDSLGRIDGNLPFQCQEVLEDLLAYLSTLKEPNTLPVKPVVDMRTVLITGVTGFIGSHFVADLLNSNEAKIEVVYLPVRAVDDASAMQRVVDKMEEAGTWDESFRSRLRVFSGDLENEQLGVSSELYDEIAASVDAVYHFASNLNLAASFQEMRQANCGCFKTIAKLCLSFRKKHLFHASTLGIFPQYFCHFGREMSGMTIERDMMPEIALMKQTFPLYMGGYAWSKLIIEIAAYRLARDNGIPLAVFRLPVMYAYGTTGHTAVSDPNNRLFMAVLQTRMVPGGQRPYVVEDADVCVEMMLRISLNKARAHTIYHCTRVSAPLPSECSPFDMLGFPCEYTTYAHFKSECQKLGTRCPLDKYWLLFDYFSKYWFSPPGHQNFQIDIDTSTVEEDCVPLPNRASLTKTLSASIEWACCHPQAVPVDISVLKASTDIETVLRPARELCNRYSMKFDTVVPEHVLVGLRKVCNVDVPQRMLPAVAFDYTSKLASRVHLKRIIEMHPEILNEPVVSPVFILGLNRTGSTFLHRMLESSGCFHVPHGEDQVLLPSAEQLSDPNPEEENDRLRLLRSIAEDAASTMQGSHDIQLGVAEEDMFAHSGAFASLEYDILYDLPEYRQWLDSQSLERVYEEHLMWVKFVLWRRRRCSAAEPANHRMCFKLPWHARSLPALLKTYPDALLVQTHRAPEQVIGSWCALVENQRLRFRENIDREKLGKDQVDVIAETLSRAMNFRASHSELAAKWIDVRFEALISNPVNACTRIIEHAGLRVSDDIKKRIEDFARTSVANRHQFKLITRGMNDYGINSQSLDTEVFRTYRQEHLMDAL